MTTRSRHKVPQATSEYKKQALWNRFFISFIFIGFTISIPMQLYNAVLALYIEHLGGNATTVGFILIVFMIAASTARIVGGSLADNIGRRVVLFGGMAIFALATGAYVLFPFIGAVFVLRALQAVGFGVANNTSMAAATDVIPPHRMGEGIGYYGLCTSLSSAIGPAIGLALIADGDFNKVFLFAAFMLAAGMFVLFFNNYEQISMKEQLSRYREAQTQRKAQNNDAAASMSFKERYIEPKALPAALIQLIFCFAMGYISNFLTLYALQAGITTAGLFFTLSAVAMMISRLTVSRVADRVPGTVIMIPSAIVGIIAFIIMPLGTQNEWIFLLSGLLYGFCTGCILPLLNTEALRPVGANRRGVASANYMLGVDFGICFGGFVWGVFIDLLGHTSAIYGSALCIGLACVLYIMLFGKKQHAK